MNRRDLLKNMSALPVLGAFAGTAKLLPITEEAEGTAGAKDYFKDLGIRTFINAAGTYTFMTGSLMRPEVMTAINYASKEYVLLDELQDKVGERIAQLLKCEYATVTSGAAAAMTLGAAGVITGMDEKKVAALPFLEGTGMKSEVIMQKAHEIAYAHAMQNVGLKIIYIETREELEKAISDKTALMYFLNANNFDGKIQVEEFLQIAQKHNIPTMIDCAADVPPVENLWKYTGMGYDLVCFSGGKGIRGPQSAGLLLGRKKYIQAARLSAPPRGNTIGRGLKVNKEEVLGMLVALETYLATDHAKEWKMWETQIKLISDAVTSVPGITTSVHVPPVANHIPTLHITWDPAKVPATAAQIRETLRKGNPSIEVADGANQHTFNVTTWMLVPGQEKIVAAQLKKVFSETHG
ncbi:aminotransferase class V-fold PLP-dependent enzyme [Chitinophaga tropicalis]|uniref:Aminotransferase class V-fold PLP-dependent enzyme n=1 Tax=Chitinophaga tropicalis TaxID=2683588 RepID=A0A7K1U6E2_9BACT|nr:aminotransferase class V-fold PLP-dependent enzyme [Chitinophaga tropicalis]MVT09933.1 aminotransferase class V-fold PLP-dependent enzyme [Chitinophaga tropicalis]